MKTFRIDSETLDYFRGLDPFETLDRLPMKGSFVLGTAEGKEDGSSDEEGPTGLMVCTIEGDRLVLHLYGGFRHEFCEEEKSYGRPSLYGESPYSC